VVRTGAGEGEDGWDEWGDGALGGKGEREERGKEWRLRRRGSREAMFFTSVAQRRENRAALTR
jgi:hypothetical protein